MLPSMRYHSAKLSQLVHLEKTYRLHISSVDKIMHKTNNQFFRRSQQLRQLKNRKEQSFSYSQYKKSKEIGQGNALLYAKITSYPKIESRDQEEPASLEFIEAKIQERGRQQKELKDNNKEDKHFVLRNHRQSPIHKSTLLERTRENIRLAKKIVNPVITYKTDDFLKKHSENKVRKDRIMKYQPQFAKTKAEMYVEKRLSQYMLNTKRSVSSLSKSLAGQSMLGFSNPEMSPKLVFKANI